MIYPLYLHIPCLDCKNEIKPSKQSFVVADIGDSATLEWSYSVKQYYTFVSIDCGKVADTTSKQPRVTASSTTERDELIVLARKDTESNFSPVISAASNLYKDRVVTSEDDRKNTLLLTIKPLRRSDYGNYRCNLNVYGDIGYDSVTIQSRIISVVGKF